ncbi:hypothetical protein [Deinococcus fonticola]|uniref:hypothetical protein n=1 Tax=Deinococcus fonticola TaxID=2528713 RepID=UPI00142FADDD|nr:hypothetical protein [Deinococcus fonticola]
MRLVTVPAQHHHVRNGVPGLKEPCSLAGPPDLLELTVGQARGVLKLSLHCAKGLVFNRKAQQNTRHDSRVLQFTSGKKKGHESVQLILAGDGNG